MFKTKDVLFLSFFLFFFGNIAAMEERNDENQIDNVSSAHLLETQCVNKISEEVYSHIAHDGLSDELYAFIDEMLEVMPVTLRNKVSIAVYAAIAEHFSSKKDIFTTQKALEIKKNIIARIEQDHYIPRKLKKMFCDIIESNSSYLVDLETWVTEDIAAFKRGFISGFKYTAAWVFGLYIYDCIKYIIETRSLEHADVLLHNTHDLKERLLHIPEMHEHIDVLRESLALVKGIHGVQNRALMYKCLLGAGSIGSFAALYTQQMQSASVDYLQEEGSRAGKMRSRFLSRYACGAVLGFTAAMLMKKTFFTIGKEVFKNLARQEHGIEDFVHSLHTMEQEICNLPQIIFQKILDAKQFPEVVEVCIKGL